MSGGRYRDRRSDPKEIIARLNKEQVRSGTPKDIFWASLDTLIQLTPEIDRAARTRQICTDLHKWLSKADLNEGDLEQYDRYVMRGISLEVPKHLNHVLLQVGSMGAKLLWSDPVYAHLNADQMFEKCMETLREMPGYDRCTDRQIGDVKRELGYMLRRYTDEKGECREFVRNFFSKHREEYAFVLRKLNDRLIAGIMEMDRRQAEAKAPEKKPAADVTVQNVGSAEPEVPEAVAAEPTVSVCERTINTAHSQVAGNKEVIFHSDEFQQVMERLHFMEKILSRISRDVDCFDDDGPGLCRFIDRTASFLYHKSLSRLYDLYVNMPEQVSVKELETILRSFFKALASLDIEPIDDRRLKADFSVEYREELEGQAGKEYRYALCGWSYKDSMVISPLFEEVKKNEDE